ncbi:MAG: ATP-binding protein [Bacteroidales bacterium]|nr:ATP-binding protein [Bacteroidales bacterium]
MKRVKIFSNRLKRFTSKAEGTGMGLYIVKNIIEKNGGYVHVQSKPNEGTTFYCFLKEYTIEL